jgi:hypothetical protein
MPDIWVPIVVALIGGPIMWGLTKFDRRNTEQHNRGMDTLYKIEDKVDGLRHDFSDHIQWHLQDRIEELESVAAKSKKPKGK